MCIRDRVGEGIEGLVHISEMSAHHVELPEQVVTPGEELWVKIIDLDLERRRISLSIKQAAEGGVVAAEYQEHFGEHNYDEEGNYIGIESSEGQEAWAEYYNEHDPSEPAVLESAETPEENLSEEPENQETEDATSDDGDANNIEEQTSDQDTVDTNDSTENVEDDSEDEEPETQS